jgi:hypothetical protein
MNYYIVNGTFYEAPNSTAKNELYHYGVPGMKWGHRKKYEPVGGSGRGRSSTPSNTNNSRLARQQARQQQRQAKQAQRNTPEAQAQRAARIEKAKKAAKIGAVIAGTALAAYGTYKLAKFVQQKRSSAAMTKANDFINNNVYRKIGETSMTDGTKRMYFEMKNGNHKLTTQGTRDVVGRTVGEHNAQVIAKGRQIYKDATSTRLDKGLAKVVNAGDAVGKAAKNAGDAVGKAAKNAGNAVGKAAKNVGNKVNETAKNVGDKVKSAVNKNKKVAPTYRYDPVSRTRVYIDENGDKVTETITEYVKRLVETS